MLLEWPLVTEALVPFSWQAQGVVVEVDGFPGDLWPSHRMNAASHSQGSLGRGGQCWPFWKRSYPAASWFSCITVRYLKHREFQIK